MFVGTTEVEHINDPAHPAIEQQEIDYLCAAINRSFSRKVSPEDIVWSYSGVRPLLDDGDESATAVTRDYRLVPEESFGPKLLSVFGGKITTYRHLAEEAVDLLTGPKGWTANSPLPGGALDNADFEAFAAAQERRYSEFPVPLIRRYASAYGTRMDRIIGPAKRPDELGRDFGGGLYEAEVRYLAAHEWARTADDILWRRTKLGLHAPPETAHNLEEALPQLLEEMKAA